MSAVFEMRGNMQLSRFVDISYANIAGRTKLYRRLDRMDKNDEFVEVKSSVFKFEEEGQTLEGEYIANEPAGLYEGTVYKIRRPSGSVVVVFGSVILNQKMQAVPLGSTVRIVYKGEVESKTKGHNPIRTFDVFYIPQ